MNEDIEIPRNSSKINDSRMGGSYEIFHPGASYPIGIFLLVVMVVSVVSNVLVILSVGLKTKGRRLKPNSLPILALALSDICFSLSIHPMLLVTSFGIPSEDIFSPNGCNWYGFGAIFFGCLSMLIHGSVSYSRLKNILYPTQAQWKSLTFHLTLLFVDCAIAFIFALAPVLGWGRYETFEFGCTVAFHDGSPEVRSYVISILIFVLGAPFVICVVSYARILHFSYKCKLQLFSLQSQYDVNSLVHTPNLGQSSLHEDVFAEDSTSKSHWGVPAVNSGVIFNSSRFEANQQKSELISSMDKRLTKVTLLTAAAFFVGWAPFAVLSIWETFYPPKQIPVGYRVAAALLCKTATVFNPCIYFCMSQSFREDLRSFFIKLNPCTTRPPTGPQHRRRVRIQLQVLEPALSQTDGDHGGSFQSRASLPSKKYFDRQTSLSNGTGLMTNGRSSMGGSSRLQREPQSFVVKGGYPQQTQRMELSCDDQGLSRESRRLPYFRNA
ncbi:opsin-5-like [Tigriopus californicus]|uniref:opsin-5-like n=1 Tax=Tigriopus californicus TaxID=6832 RepID=UPI0027DA9341|nr:opsin-5-like [Tigriopus californicus]